MSHGKGFGATWDSQELVPPGGADSLISGWPKNPEL